MNKVKKFTNSFSSHQISNNVDIFSSTIINKTNNKNPGISTQLIFKRQCNHPYLSPQIQCEKVIERYLYDQHQAKKQTVFHKNLGKILFQSQEYHQKRESKPMLRLLTNNSLLLSSLKSKRRSLSQSKAMFDNYNIKQLRNRILNIDHNHHQNYPYLIDKNTNKNNKQSTINRFNKPSVKLKGRSVYSIYTLINQQQLLQQKQQSKVIALGKRKVEEDKAIAISSAADIHLRSKLVINHVTDYLAKTVSSNNSNESTCSFSIEQVIGYEAYKIFGVCNGIGPEKKIYSSIAKEILTDYLASSAFWLISSDQTAKRSLFDKLNYNDYEIIRKILLEVNEELSKRNYDFENNGTTIAILFIIGKRIISVNMGNDQILLLKKEVKKGEEHLKICSLTEDHSINNTKEKMRIEDKLGSFKEIETTRAIGLNKFIDQGLLREPYIYTATIESNWDSIVIGTKSVWENCLSYNICKVFFSNDEDIIAKMNKVIQFKRRQLESGLMKDDFSFSIIIINFS